ncbi:MAG: SH3 domain-containing protein [Thermoplasmata archaeon]
MHIIINGVADIRKLPKFRSERISQLIYGETFNIIEDLGEFTYIEGGDGVRGYVKTTNIGEGKEIQAKGQVQGQGKDISLRIIPQPGGC